MSEIQQGLLITAIGMSLVFVVIIFLWGMMALLVRVTSKKEEMPEIETEIQSETTLPKSSPGTFGATASGGCCCNSRCSGT